MKINKILVNKYSIYYIIFYNISYYTAKSRINVWLKYSCIFYSCISDIFNYLKDLHSIVNSQCLLRQQLQELINHLELK